MDVLFEGRRVLSGRVVSMKESTKWTCSFSVVSVKDSTEWTCCLSEGVDVLFQ